ncbi:MAG: universal stress protein [Anaerolineales bacterium]
MSGVICPIRGGPGSKATIETAIQLAISEAMPLTFLYVVNVDFLSHTETGRVRTITSELESMGDFILLSAKAKAEEQGVQANAEIRHGDVGERIVELAQETRASFLVMGRPGGEGEEHVFEQEQLDSFIERLEEATGSKVIIAEGAQS